MNDYNAGFMRLWRVLFPDRVAPEQEYRFHPDRKWRFDFAWPDSRLAVEIEGLTRGGGRHQRMTGYTSDCEKYREAVRLGWRVLRYTSIEMQERPAQIVEEVAERLGELGMTPKERRQ